MTTIVLATANPHKVEELAAILAPVGVRLLSLAEAPGAPFPEPAETGTTFAQNAKIKAMAYAAATGLLCLADDSGLIVDALAGAPGVISSHYATAGVEDGATRAQRDARNNAKLLADLARTPDDLRSARFACVMALAQPHSRAQSGLVPPGTTSLAAEIIATTQGTFEGRIGRSPDVPRGSNGFGYDPLFLVGPEHTRTGAELPSDEKNRRSHRAIAAGRMVQRLIELGIAGSRANA